MRAVQNGFVSDMIAPHIAALCPYLVIKLARINA